MFMDSRDRNSPVVVCGTEAGSDWNPKLEAQKLWNKNPCGGQVGEYETPREFFAAVDRERYGSYAPWLRQAINFSRFRGQRVLEIGCGMGTDLAQIASAGGNSFAIDLTVRHLEIAKRRLSLIQLGDRLVRTDAETLPFQSRSFDAVYSFGVLHHTPDIGAAIQEIRRVLRPGGTLTLAVYHRHSVFYWLFTIIGRGLIRRELFRHGYQRLLADIEYQSQPEAVPLVRVYARRELRRLLNDFRDVHIETHHVDFGHFGYLAPLLRRVMSRGALERYGHRWGWYVLARATL